jgi:hypothetical protein
VVKRPSERRLRTATRRDEPSTATPAARPPKDRTIYVVVGGVVCALALVVGLVVVVGGLGSSASSERTTDEVIVRNTSAPTSPDQARLDEAEKFAAEHPDDYLGQASRYHDVAEHVRDAEIARKAAQLADESRARLSDAARRAADKLLERAHEAEGRKDYEVACAILDRPPAIVARDERLSAELARERRRLGYARSLVRARSAVARDDAEGALAELRDLLDCGDASVERDARALKVDAERIQALARSGGDATAEPAPTETTRPSKPPPPAVPPVPQEPTREQWVASLEEITKAPLETFVKQRDAALAAAKTIDEGWRGATSSHEIGVREDMKRLKGRAVSPSGKGLEHCPVGRIDPADPGLYMAFQRPEQSRLEFAADPDDALPRRIALRLHGRALAPHVAPGLAFTKLHLSINSIPQDDIVIYSQESDATTVEITRAWQAGSKNVVAITLARSPSPFLLSSAEVLTLSK